VVTKQLCGLSGSMISVNSKPWGLYVKLLLLVAVNTCALAWVVNNNDVNNDNNNPANMPTEYL
jgi:hypothetical protein